MGRPPIGKVAMTGAERVRRYRLKHGTSKPVTKPVTKSAAEDRIEVLEAELARERQQAALAAAEITELKAQLANERKRRAAAEVKPASDREQATTAPPTDADRVIKRLRDRNRAANAEIRHLRQRIEKLGIPQLGSMSHATYRTLLKALHPDHLPSEAERTAACAAFNAWVDSQKPARM